MKAYRNLLFRKKGLSLIEVVTALVILGLILGGMLGIFWQGSNAARRSQTEHIAYNLLREGLEEASIWPPSSQARAPVNGFGDFEREVAVTSPYLGYNNLARIRVTVWWDNGTQSQSIETLKANY